MNAPLPKKPMPMPVFQRLLNHFKAALPAIVPMPVGHVFTIQHTTPAEGVVTVSLQMSLSGEYAPERTDWKVSPLDCAWEVTHGHVWWKMTEEQQCMIAATVIDRVPITILIESQPLPNGLVEGFWHLRFAGFAVALSFGLLGTTNCPEQFNRAIDALLSNVPMFDQTPPLIAEACLRMLQECGTGVAVLPPANHPPELLMHVVVSRIRVPAKP